MIKGVIERSVRMVEEDARKNKTTIGTHVPSGSTTFLLDADQMVQALLNLLLNSLQAIDAGGSIEVGAALTGAGSELSIWVEDDGPGIPDEHKQTVFDPFVTTREKGTGLGLVIVRKIVDGHRGNISIESPAPGRDRGCRFAMALPVRSPEDGTSL